MRKIIDPTPGDIIKIPLTDGTHTYARILVDDTYAIYDFKTFEDILDLQHIQQKSILFMAWVDVFGIREGHWKIMGNLPLEGKLNNFYPRYFMAAPTDDSNIGFYNVYKDEIEEAIEKDWIGDKKIQLGGLHGRVHIELRIMDYYEGKRNKNNSMVIKVFKKYLGLPLNESLSS